MVCQRDYNSWYQKLVLLGPTCHDKEKTKNNYQMHCGGLKVGIIMEGERKWGVMFVMENCT
jgi:hypothetical protein